MILVIGATGTIGTQLVTQLSGAGYPVRALTRNLDKAAKFKGGIEIVAGDLDDEESLVKAMYGVERFFLITANTRQDRNALAAAIKAGATHVVKISTQEAGWSSVQGHGHWHKEREDLIRASGLKWTFLRPSMYMSFALTWAKSIQTDNAIYAAGGQGEIGSVDPQTHMQVQTRCDNRIDLTQNGYTMQLSFDLLLRLISFTDITHET